MTISWNDNLKTGIHDIDEQHQQLFETINKLEKFKESNIGLKDVLVELQTYMLRHFKTEEEYMRYTNYPDYTAHKNAHDKVLEDYREIMKKDLATDFALNPRMELTTFIEDWLTDHYTNTDVKMADYIRNCQQNNV